MAHFDPRESGVYFFHIPKTAGVTVWKAIDSAYEKDSICPWWLWDQLIDVSKAELSHYRVFRGHFYGFLESFLERELAKFTILREPVDRTISYYCYIRNYPDHPNHEQARSLTLREFCVHEKTRYLVENYQAGYLASFVFTRDPVRIASLFTPDDRKKHLFQAILEPSVSGMDATVLLKAAEEGLRQFRVVGITERLPRSLELINAALGCSMSLPSDAQNVTPERILLADLDKATIDVIHRITEVDRILYNRIAGPILEEK